MTKDIDELSFKEVGVEKNNAFRCIIPHSVDEGLSMYICEGQVKGKAVVEVTVPAGLVQLTFSADGDSEMHFSPHYSQTLASNECMLLYNPSMDLNYRYEFTHGSRQLFLFLTVKKLHRLLISGDQELHFLNDSNIGKKYYTKSGMSPQLRMSIDELYSTSLSALSNPLFRTSKALECLSFYFHVEEQADFTENCPFLKDQRNLDAVRKSKEILIENMASPPTIKDISLAVGLNEYQLKLGFKNIYGNTMHNYLVEYKLNHALKLMVTDKFKVQEAADAIGYSNPSHFIAAFKKKFGVTPKKYMMGHTEARMS